MRALPTISLDDPKAEQVRSAIVEAIRALQLLVRTRTGVVVESIALADGVETTVAHGLGRRPRHIAAGVPRGATAAGVITEVKRDTKLLVLRADDFGATITIDLEVK